MRLAELLVRPVLWLMTRPEWRGQENIPASGPAILVFNHISYADPFVASHFVFDRPRELRFLAKASLFKIPIGSYILRQIHQIPVQRYSTDAVKALQAAIAALNRGEAVVIYPEGTCTKDPELWPMQGRTGVARLALLTGAPVIPIAQWGAQRIHHPITRKLRLRPKTPVTVPAGRLRRRAARGDRRDHAPPPRRRGRAPRRARTDRPALRPPAQVGGAVPGGHAMTQLPTLRAAVLGAGSWGTAFGKVLADAGCDVTLWARRAEVAKCIEENRDNADYLPGIRLPDRLRGTHDAAEALDGADLVVLAVPSQTLRANLTGWVDDIGRDATLVSLMKGVELGTMKRMSEVIVEVA